MELLKLVRKRKAIAKKIAAFKKAHKLPIASPSQEEHILSEALTLAECLKISPCFVSALCARLIKQSKQVQEEYFQREFEEGLFSTEISLESLRKEMQDVTKSILELYKR